MPVRTWSGTLLAGLLLFLAAAANPAEGGAGTAASAQIDTDGDTLPDVLEPRAGLDPRRSDLLSYVGGPGCSDRRGATDVRSPERPWCGLERAAEAAPAGATVLVRTGTYERFTFSRGFKRRLRLRAYPGEEVVLRGADISGSGLRLERFRLTGTVNVASAARRVSLVANRWITDGLSGGTNLNIDAGARRVLVERNTIAQRGSVGAATAINLSSTDTKPPISGVRILNNRIGPLPGGGDAIQAKNTRSLLVEGNEIFGLSRPPGSGAHPDAVQTLYGAVNLTLRRNFIHDIAAQGVFVQNFRGANRGITAEDNVIVRVAYPWTAFAVDAEGVRVVHNTVDGLLLARRGTRRAVVIANIASALVFSPGVEATRGGYNLARRFVPTASRRSVLGAPRYRKPRRNDFRLRRDSPGFRKGPRGTDIGSRWADWSKQR